MLSMDSSGTQLGSLVLHCTLQVLSQCVFSILEIQVARLLEIVVS